MNTTTILEEINAVRTEVNPAAITPTVVASLLKNIVDYIISDISTKSDLNTEKSTRANADQVLAEQIEATKAAINNRIDALIGANATDAIENFNEIIAFLSGIKDNERLSAILGEINKRMTELTATDATLAQSIADVQIIVGNAATSIGNKVDKVSGKGLSTNDYTTAEKNKLADLKTSDIKHGVRPLNLWMQGVNEYQTNADNLHNAVFADATKAVNTANAASAKVNEIDEFHSVILNDHEARITAEEAKMLNVMSDLPKLQKWITSTVDKIPDASFDTVGIDNVEDVIYFLAGISDNVLLKEILDNKLDKSSTKGLSTNDFTNEAKAKLATININDIANAVNTANAASTKVEEIDESHSTILNSHEERISENEQSLKDVILATNNNGWRELIESSFNANNYSRMRCVFIYQLSGKNEYATMMMEIDIDTIRNSAVNTGIYTYKQHAIIYPAAPDMVLNTVIEFSITFDKADQTAQFSINNAPNYIQTTKYYLQ